MPINKTTITVIIILIACMAIALYWIYKKRLMLQASKITKEIYAVWAALGPFENGAASAKAMHCANIVVRDLDSLNDQKYNEAISLHEKAYNTDPVKWEELRQRSLSGATCDKFEMQLAKAKEIASNDIALRNFGEQLLDDGSKASKDLISLLNEIYKSRYGTDIEDSLKLGFIYAQVYSESLRHQDEDIYRVFIQLSEKWKKTDLKINNSAFISNSET